MSEFIIVSVKDTCTKEFLAPQFVHNHEEAKRLFKWQLEKTPTWKENAEQFHLYDLGLFDTNSGNIIGNDEVAEAGMIPVVCHPELICKGTDLIDVRKE